MPSSAEHGSWAIDTSVAVAFLDAGHSAHTICVTALTGRRVALAGHAAFETYSVLTRLPEPARVVAGDAQRAIESAFPEACWLDSTDQAGLIAQWATLGIVGGAVFDALVGEAAKANDRTLVTRDRRARPVYDLLGVRYEMLG